MPSRLITIKQAAEWLGLTTYYVRSNPHELGLKVIRTEGGHRRYDADEVMALLERFKDTEKHLARWSPR